MPGPKPDQAGAKSSSMAFQSQGLQLGQAISQAMVNGFGSARGLKARA